MSQGAFHALLAGMAGRVPDEFIPRARRWLVSEQYRDVAQGIAFVALAGGVAVSDHEADLLSETLPDPQIVTALRRSEDEPPPPYALSPVRLDVLIEDPEIAYRLDLTRPYAGPGGTDEKDRAAIAAVAELQADSVRTKGLWRSWRFPAEESPWPPPRRIYLVQVSTTSAAALLVAELAVQDALESAGEADPQVVGFTEPGALATFARTALAFSSLLWAEQPSAGIRIAPVFDDHRPEHGPQFDADHPLMDPAEAAAVAAYLEGGVPLLASSEAMPDVVDPDAGGQVPLGYRTDGVWIWAEASTYYLSRYGLAPDRDLLAHVAAGGTAAEVDAVTLHRALSALYEITREDQE